jgi:hypothetical protein
MLLHAVPRAIERSRVKDLETPAPDVNLVASRPQVLHRVAESFKNLRKTGAKCALI